MGRNNLKLYGVGNALLHYREKKGLSQTQVCEGICTEMTISRIETGEREFDSMISETLLSRVGKTAYRFEFVLNEEDYKLYELRENIEKFTKEGKVEAAKEKLHEYEDLTPSDSVLHKQFIVYYQALLMEREKWESKDIIKLFHEAIDLTRPDYKEKTYSLRLYSAMELKIIYHLFLYEHYEEEDLESVFRFVEEIYDEEEKRNVMLPFYLYLVKRYEEEENFHEMKRISGQAVSLILSGRSYLHLMDFYYYELWAEYELNKDIMTWKEKRKELFQRCNEIYYMSMAIDDADMMEKVKVFSEDKIGWQIIM